MKTGTPAFLLGEISRLWSQTRKSAFHHGGTETSRNHDGSHRMLTSWTLRNSKWPSLVFSVTRCLCG